MTKYIKNLSEKTESILRESLIDDAAKLLDIDNEQAEEQIKELSFANYLELGNAVDLEDADTIREILGIGEDTIRKENVNESFQLLSLDQMAKLTTKRLLAYYKARRKEYMQDQNSAFYDGDGVYTKELEKTLQAAKKILSSREHVSEDRYDDATEECPVCYGRGIEYGETCVRCGGKGRIRKTGEYIDDEWRDEISALDDADLTVDDLREADNPYQKATPPSAGSSIDTLKKSQHTAEPAPTAAKNQEVNRKTADDLDVGDEIEVATVDGKPAGARVMSVRGPGDTIVVRGDKQTDHMVKKDQILSTPVIERKSIMTEELSRMRQLAGLKQNITEAFRGATDKEYNMVVSILKRMGYRPHSMGVDSETGNIHVKDNLAKDQAEFVINPEGKILSVKRAKDADATTINHGIEEDKGKFVDRLSGMPDLDRYWIYINRPDVPYVMYHLPRSEAKENEPRFLKVDKETGDWQTQKWKRNNEPAVQSGKGSGPHVVEEARQGGKTEHSGAKKGKGAYYGRKKDAKADSKKRRRHADKNIVDEADGSMHFFVDPLAQGANVMNSNGDIHDYYDDPKKARQVAAELNAKYAVVENEEDDWLNQPQPVECIYCDGEDPECEICGGKGELFEHEEMTHREEVEYWKESLEDSMKRKGVWDKALEATNGDIKQIRYAIADEAESITDRYHGSGEGIGTSDINHFIVGIFSQLGVDDVFGWRTPKNISESVDMSRMRQLAGLKENAVKEAKPASNAKNYTRMGGNKEQYDWRVTLKNGKTKTVSADSRKSAWDHLSTDERIIGVNKIVKLSESRNPWSDAYRRSSRRQMKAGPFKSKAIGSRVQVVTKNSEHTGEVGEVVGAYREHTFSQMVPYVIEYRIEFDDGSTEHIRREGVRKVKKIEEAVQKIACLACDQVSTKKAWAKNNNFCPKCKKSNKGVAESRTGIKEDHQKKIAIDTVKNPDKALLGGPSAKEAEDTLRKKYGYTDKQIQKLKETATAGGTGAGAIATSPAAMAGVQRRLQSASIYGKPAPKKRSKKKDTTEGVGRMKKLKEGGMYNSKQQWLADAKAMGYDLEEGGDDKIYAHIDGKEYGYWDKNYGGVGSGFFYEDPRT